MSNSGQEAKGTIGFYEQYSGFSDFQIKEILKKNKNYQESAVNAAIKIAIERGIINSEQDLLAPEYQAKASTGLSLFPLITNAYHYKKVNASIFRVLFILSFFPIIFGVMKYAEGQSNITFIGVGLGLVWLILTFILFKTRKLIVLFLQVIILISVFFGIFYRLVIQTTFQITDMLMLVIGTFLSLYLLLYLRKLIQTKPDTLSDL